MKQVLILGRQGVVEKNDSKTLATLLADPTLTVAHAYLEDCVFIINRTPHVMALAAGRMVDIANFSLVLLTGWSGSRVLSDMAHTIALYAQNRQVVCWNSELLHARSMTKLSQLFRAAHAGAQVPHSVFSLNHEAMVTAATQHLPGNHLICKDIEASRGRRNELVARADMTVLLAKYSHAPMMLQEHIPNNGSDVRLVVLGGQIGLVIQRQGMIGTHLTNTSQGGQATLLSPHDFPPDIIQQAAKLSREFGREVCGIDYIQHTTTGHYIFLEINMMPQLVTGAFVNNKIDSLRQAIRDTLK